MQPNELKEIRIQNLFGTIPEHIIELKEGGITFIHGPNGCGKTTSLRLIAGALKWEIPIFFEINFGSIVIKKANGETLTITKMLEERGTKQLPTVTATSSSGNHHIIKRRSNDLRLNAIDIEEYNPNLVRVGAREWLDRESGIRYD